ncbi:MAG TPA: DUF4468 domain-containing protein [Bacteroidota bacterium]|nr:DUF4468 domain-containing protein [Bacteroidota bacterium]
MTSRIHIVALSALLCASAQRAGAQEANREEMNHEFIFDFSGHGKQQIYDRMMNWVLNNLRSPGAVVQTDDPGTGTIVANGVTTMTPEGDSVQAGLSFRMSVDVREGKERVRFLNLQISRGSDAGWDDMPPEAAWHRGAQKRFLQLARLLSEYIRSAPSH